MDSQTPAFPPPTGVVSNFVDPVSHANGLIACNVFLLVVGFLIVAARVVARTVLTDWRLGWDDCKYSSLRLSSLEMGTGD